MKACQFCASVAFLVGTHQAAITGDHRRQDSRSVAALGLVFKNRTLRIGELLSIYAASGPAVPPGPMSELGQTRKSGR